MAQSKSSVTQSRRSACVREILGVMPRTPSRRLPTMSARAEPDAAPVDDDRSSGTVRPELNLEILGASLPRNAVEVVMRPRTFTGAIGVNRLPDGPSRFPHGSWAALKALLTWAIQAPPATKTAATGGCAAPQPTCGQRRSPQIADNESATITAPTMMGHRRTR